MELRSAASMMAACLFLAGLLGVGACRPLASEAQLEWCSLNQTRVARAALELGLMERGTDFTQWKQADVDGYNRACISAFEE